MKRRKPAARILYLLLGGMLCSFPATAMDIDDAPESVTLDYLQKLYEPVTFDHRMHAENYACNACHHHTTGDGPHNETCGKCHATSPEVDDVSCSGCHTEKNTAPAPAANDATGTVYHIDKPGIKGALHLQCLGCHMKEGGPTECQECHALTPAGRKRFLVKE